MVYDENNNPIGNAEISVAGINHDVTSGESEQPAGCTVAVIPWLLHWPCDSLLGKDSHRQTAERILRFVFFNHCGF